jgi:hypothetical protein
MLTAEASLQIPLGWPLQAGLKQGCDAFEDGFTLRYKRPPRR